MTAHQRRRPSGTAVLRAVRQSGDPQADERAEHYRFVASVIELGERIPCGATYSVGILLQRSLDEIQAFLAEHDCSGDLAAELLRQLTAWLEHERTSAGYAQRCDELMRHLVTLLAEKHRPTRLRSP